jgi:hypothetical protein
MIRVSKITGAVQSAALHRDSGTPCTAGSSHANALT